MLERVQLLFHRVEEDGLGNGEVKVELEVVERSLPILWHIGTRYVTFHVADPI